MDPAAAKSLTHYLSSPEVYATIKKIRLEPAAKDQK
jgi:hypothetical protein